MERDPASADGRDGYLRRRLLQLGGLATVPFLHGGLTGSGERGRGTQTVPPMHENDTSGGKTLEIGPNLNLGGRRIVSGPGEIGYDTVSAAYDDAESGDQVVVHATYDAEASDEAFPIVLNQDEKEVMLTGGHPSGSVIDARHTNENVLEIYGRGFNDYRNRATVQNLKLVGGNVGVTVRGAPYSSYRNLVCYQNGSHGVQVSPYVDENGAEKGSFGVTFTNCVAWSCRGSGFRLEPDAYPHSTTFDSCHAMYNGVYGPQTSQPGVQLRGYSSRWYGGTVQGNGGVGIDARAGGSQTIIGTYFEGNGQVDESPHDIFVGRGANALSIRGAYFQGNYGSDSPNERDQAYRAIELTDVTGAALTNCTVRNYEKAFVHARNTTDTDLHIHSHVVLDDTPLLDLGANERLRSNGLILETDVTGDVAGAYVGDQALHDGNGRLPWGPAMWNGDRWVSVVDGTKSKRK